jgi:hypothetical protein
MDDNQKELDNVFSALHELFLAELVKLGEPAAEALTRAHAAGAKIRFEIELPGSLTCSIQRGAGNVVLFCAEGAPPKGTLVTMPKSD